MAIGFVRVQIKGNAVAFSDFTFLLQTFCMQTPVAHSSVGQKLQSVMYILVENDVCGVTETNHLQNKCNLSCQIEVKLVLVGLEAPKIWPGVRIARACNKCLPE